jgi:glycosyltransferase involved in cell wall biosynthesis
MARKNIGFLFLYSYKEWTGGIIYIMNIISALKTLDDHEKPEITILFTSRSPLDDLKAINYPYITYTPIDDNSLVKKILNRLSIHLLGKSLYAKRLPEVTYPYHKLYCKGKKPYFWIPDFQEWYLPQMFSEEDVRSRKKTQSDISKTKGVVIFSSEDALKDFQTFYPNYVCDLRLLHFACALPSFEHVKIDSLRKKFDIEGEYFMSPNQFWKHKNHKVILEAINDLKAKNLNFQVVFTGSESDHRNKEYYSELKAFIDDNNLQRWVKFLGFIDRAEQLQLMQCSRAVIQPSFFEGWSTVVEDSKALNKYILLSDIGVHREQIKENCIFFDPKSAHDLSEKIEQTLTINPPIYNIDYQQYIKTFARNIMTTLV